MQCTEARTHTFVFISQRKKEKTKNERTKHEREEIED